MGSGDAYLIPDTGGEETRLTFDKHVWALDWTPDSREVIYSAFDSFGQTSLWSVSRDGGEPQRLPFGANANMVSIARKANLLAYAQSNLQLNLWRVGGPTAEPPTPPERLIASTYWDIQPRFSPDDGTRLAFSTSRSGEMEVWICDGNGDDCGRLSDGWQPAWSRSWMG